VFSFNEFKDDFDWRKVNPVGPIFDLKKLDWLNGVYIRDLEVGDFAHRLLPFLKADGVLGDNPTLGELARLRKVAELIQTRIVTLAEATPLVAPFYVADQELEIADDARAGLGDDAVRVLDTALESLSALDDTGTGVLGSESAWNAPAIEAALRSTLIDGLGLKPKFAFGPLRTAVSGARISPPLFESMEILGKHSTIARLRRLREDLA
jgi:glutamyl-tRNA synthetase